MNYEEKRKIRQDPTLTTEQKRIDLHLLKKRNKKRKEEQKQRPERKYGKQNDILRLIIVALVFLIELTAVIWLFIWLDNKAVWVNTVFRILAVIVALAVFTRPMNSAFKFPWIMLIVFMPIAGVTIYLLLGNRFSDYSVRNEYAEIDATLSHYIAQDNRVTAGLEKKDIRIAHQLEYPYKTNSLYPVFKDTDITYYEDVRLAYADQLKEAQKARRFIFLEYFAIEDKEAFVPLKKILEQKVKEGVKVRVFYDNIGSIGYVNRSFLLDLRKRGIEAQVFNPISTFWKVTMNNRDHRKIMVIDGKTGYTGGYNIANEYFGITHPYGEWKDAGVKIEGKAVNALTLMFLENWNAIRREDEDFAQYINTEKYPAREKDGFITCYACSPLSKFPLGEDVYMNLLKNARHYVYFTTPYLILTDDMIREMVSAVQRGIDVRIITPGIPDKKIIYRITRTFYHDLIQGGMKIYEYTPGFDHAKIAVSDDEIATVGTINLDYRSLYLHFEDGTLFYNYKAVQEVKEDFLKMQSVSKEITKDNKLARKNHKLIRLLAPLL